MAGEGEVIMLIPPEGTLGMQSRQGLEVISTGPVWCLATFKVYLEKFNVYLFRIPIFLI